MQLRKSNEKDLEVIMKIINQAQKYLKGQGIDQWQNNYPNLETIISDINKDESYVLVKNGEIIGTSVISFNGEKTYERIYDGSWLNNEDFAVIHRIAVDNNHKGKGVASKFLNFAGEMCKNNQVKSIKIDTHRKNISMQHLKN